MLGGRVRFFERFKPVPGLKQPARIDILRKLQKDYQQQILSARQLHNMRRRFTGFDRMALARRINAKRRKLSIPRRLKGLGYSGFGRTSTIEKKYLDTAIGVAAFDTAGTILNSGTIIVIPQGTTAVTRIGKKVVITNIHMRGKINVVSKTSQTAPPTGTIFRIIIYVDKQANKATAAVTDILNTASYLSFNNLTNSKRFVTLYDKTSSINYNMYQDKDVSTNTAIEGNYGGRVRHIGFNKRCRIPIEYSSTTGAIGEITSNNIGVLCIANNANSQYAFEFRVRFTDS